jgi:hypothetical protein
MGINYVFSKARNGDVVPAIITASGETKHLHSTVDPRHEASRLVSTIPEDTGFLIFLGLGGGYAPEAALEKTGAKILVIEYDGESVKRLLACKDYAPLLNSGRFTLLTDPSNEDIHNFILENYNPALYGGIKSFPLRTRTEHSQKEFENAAAGIQKAVEAVSADFSVQAHFGTRWFSNIIRNIKNIDTMELDTSHNSLPARQAAAQQAAAIVAAGPSLDTQLDSLLKFKSGGGYIICSDTAFPVLAHNGIDADIIVSIDCQHISYYHFTDRKPKDSVPLVLDLASPPLLCGITDTPVFFSSGHPLARYAAAAWRPFLQLDTSGGNVTYACLSLAEKSGAKDITLFGADFSYVRGRSYARGTYIYPFFERKQNRLNTMEALFSRFLYRAPFLPPESKDQKYRETSSLRFYREKLEEKAAGLNAKIRACAGDGAPIKFSKLSNTSNVKPVPQAPQENAKTSGLDFLRQYKNDIAACKDGPVFNTLLPYMAALKHRNKELKQADLLAETKRRCIEEIDKIL